MLLGGVAVDDQLVRDLIGILDKSLGHKLHTALLFRAKVVGLTRDERRAILAAIDRTPGLEDARQLLLEGHEWRASAAVRGRLE
jgi:hypothetical protein